MKATKVENNYIIKIKIINKIQHLKIYKDYNVVFYIIIYFQCEQNDFFISFKQ